MPARIRMLGRPEIEGCDAGTGQLRGVKPWAVLARVLLADAPVSRRALATELFPEAADPLGSVRWSLASIRSALGSPGSLTGDPVEPMLPTGLTVDALEVLAGRLDLSAMGELLEGMEPVAGPEFSTWLFVVRRHLSGRIDALLHDEIIHAMSRGQPERAVELGGVAVRRSPYDERAHVLFVRALAAAGDGESALDHVLEVERLFLSELGCEPSPALRSAARRSIADEAPGVSRAAVASSLLDAGQAAVTAGATEAGIDCLRRAAAAAGDTGDEVQQARCLLALGNALVHSVRGFDDEGSVVLDEAAHLARLAGDRDLAVQALRERGYVDALAGRRPEAQSRLDLARDLADGDAGLVAGVDGVAGLNFTDWGRFDEGIACFESSIEHARSAGDDRRVAWAQGVGAWSLVGVGRVDEGRVWASSSLDIARSLRWMAFEPWPLTVLAEATPEQSVDELEWCFAMSCQLEDPCWEGASARAMAAACADAGDLESALRWIKEARQRAARKSDVWVRVVGEILLSEAALHLQNGERATANGAARDVVSLAATTQLDDVLRRALELLETTD